MTRTILTVVVAAGVALASAQPSDVRRAAELYRHTLYAQSLEILTAIPEPGEEVYELLGKNYYATNDYKKAGDAFAKAFSLEPNNSGVAHWMGKVYGRKAEANPLFAPANAAKARQYFEKAVELDGRNEEALNDLFDYYLQAPGFLGGGEDKAEAVAQRIAAINAAEGHYAQAQLAQKRKEYDEAERHYRQALELAPHQVGRVIDLARHLARHGKIEESDALFARAEKIAPNSPKVLYAKAHLYVDQSRHLDQAQALLRRYLESNLTPDDPPREEARKLLKRAESGA